MSILHYNERLVAVCYFTSRETTQPIAELLHKRRILLENFRQRCSVIPCIRLNISIYFYIYNVRFKCIVTYYYCVYRHVTAVRLFSRVSEQCVLKRYCSLLLDLYGGNDNNVRSYCECAAG